MNEVKQERCKHCEFSRELGALESGQLAANGEQAFICRRNPPLPVPVPFKHHMTGEMQLSIQGVNPPVRSDDWCGEFKWKHSTKVIAS